MTHRSFRERGPGEDPADIPVAHALGEEVVAAVDDPEQRARVDLGEAAPALQGDHGVSLLVAPLGNADLLARGLGVGLAPSEAQHQAAVGLADVGAVEGGDLGAAEGAGESEEEHAAVTDVAEALLRGGREGCEVAAAKPVGAALNRYAEAVNLLCDYAIEQGYQLRMALEPKPNEPRGDLLLPTVGHALAFINELEHPDMVGPNPEFAHETMSGLAFNQGVAHLEGLVVEQEGGVHVPVGRTIGSPRSSW